MNRRVSAAVDAAHDAQGQLWTEWHRRATCHLEMGGQARQGTLVSGQRRVDGEGVAGGGIKREVGAIEVDQNLADPNRNPADDLRERVGDGGDLSGSRVDMDCGPDRDIAQIVWSRDGWDDGQEAERRAFFGPARYTFPGR